MAHKRWISLGPLLPQELAQRRRERVDVGARRTERGPGGERKLPTAASPIRTRRRRAGSKRLMGAAPGAARPALSRGPGARGGPETPQPLLTGVPRPTPLSVPPGSLQPRPRPALAPRRRPITLPQWLQGASPASCLPFGAPLSITLSSRLCLGRLAGCSGALALLPPSPHPRAPLAWLRPSPGPAPRPAPPLA